MSRRHRLEPFLKENPADTTYRVIRNIDAILKPIFNQYKDTTARIVIMHNNEVIDEFRMDYKNKPVHASYDRFRTYFVPESDQAPIVPDNLRIRVIKSRKLRKQEAVQAFREGANHCVFTPLIALWSEKITDRTQRILNKVKKLADLYGDKPVPSTEMETIAKQCETTIRIYDPLNKPYKTYNPSSRKTLHLKNTFLNHVDPTLEKLPIKLITHQEALNITNNLPQGTAVEGSMQDPIRIHTGLEILEVENPMKPFIQEIYNLIPDIALNATLHPKVNEFILESRIINSATLRFQETYDAHYDLEKAYTQFHKTKFYRGFLGKIHQWRNFTFPPTQDFLNKHNGIYGAKIINPSPLAKLLGFKSNEYYILPLPEWEFHKSTNTTFTILNGIFGSTFDFRFPESSKQDVATRSGKINKPFRIFAGQLSSKINEHDRKTFIIKSTKEFAQHLSSLYPETHYDHESQTAQIPIQYKQVYTNHHLFSFITSYTRIIMMEEMMKFNIDNLSAVTLDGLYFKGKAPKDLIPEFRKKHSTAPIGNNLWYNTTPTFTFPPLTNFNQSSFLEGPGGSGKTHSILNDKGFNTILYTSPTHALGKDKVEEYKLEHYTTVHRLIGENCKSYKEEYGEPAVIFVDEITQIEASFITRIINMYPNSLIFIAGDVDAQGRHFQCKYSNDIWKPTLPIIQFTNDYRAKTQSLKEMKITLRNYMKTDPTPQEIKAYVRLNFETISKEQAIEQFTETDVWIAGTHRYIKTIPHKVHTTHSYQGKTITNPTKLYISIDDMFESTMFYTAMSRVEDETQLIIVS